MASQYEKNENFHVAVRNGDTSKVIAALTDGADLHSKDKNNLYGITALNYASGAGKHQMVQFLIDKGANVHDKDEYGYTALHVASMNGKNEVVQLLIEKGADVHAKDQYGYTALHVAGMDGKHEVVQCLIEKGANVHSKNNKGHTALDLASHNGNEQIVNMLLGSSATNHSSTYNIDGSTSQPQHVSNIGYTENVPTAVLVGKIVNVDNYIRKASPPPPLPARLENIATRIGYVFSTNHIQGKLNELEKEISGIKRNTGGGFVKRAKVREYIVEELQKGIDALADDLEVLE